MRHSIFSHPLVTLILSPCVQEMQITVAAPQANWRRAAMAGHAVSASLQLSMNATLAPGTFQTSVHLKPQLWFHTHTISGEGGGSRERQSIAHPGCRMQDAGCWYPVLSV